MESILNKHYNRHLIITFLLLLVVIAIFELTNLDMLVQDYCYNFVTESWRVDRDNPLVKFLIYDGLKRLLVAFFIVIFLCLIFGRKMRIIQEYQKGLCIIVFSAILIPTTVGLLKKTTKVPCPRNLIEYKGVHPHVTLFQRYPATFLSKKRIKCWPAGHPSIAFALMSLCFLFKKRRNQIVALIVAMVIGWIMGIYKMLIGDHFLSHTIVTMILSWLIVLIVAKNITQYQLFFKQFTWKN